VKTILVIAGTRPEIIKTAPIVLAARNRKDIKVKYCLTGQHKTMAIEAYGNRNEEVVPGALYIRDKSFLLLSAKHGNLLFSYK